MGGEQPRPRCNLLLHAASRRCSGCTYLAGYPANPASGIGTGRTTAESLGWLVSIFVDDQDKALRFDTDVIGFVKKHDVPAGGARWFTVV